MAKIEMPTSSAGGGAARVPAASVQDRPFGMWSRSLVGPAVLDSLRKLSPAAQLKNPVMFVVYVGSILTTLLWVMALRGQAEAPAGFILAISVWLWFTVLFANFAEALAEGRGKQQAATLRGLRTTINARLLKNFREADVRDAQPGQWRDQAVSQPSGRLRRDDVVLIEAGETIPGDGQVIAGVASVDESAITGESAPVIRESGGDFSSVTGGTRVLSDWIFVRIAADPGESFLDRMIAMVEGAKRQ
ncbi:MAG: potassium-transporting ATPase subunit B, partial [Achromobacter pestifer]